jgi:hypothetical protein
MAIREIGRYKRITASGGGTLAAPSNEAYRLRDLFCTPSSNDTYLTLDIGGKTVLKIRVKGKSGNHAAYPGAKTTQLYEAVPRTLMAILRAAGFDMSVPIPAGYTLTVSRYAETGEVTLVYDVFDAADVRPDEPNGPDSKVQRYLHYLTNASAITASPATFDTSLIWTGGEAWPVGGVFVPDQVTINLAAIIGAPVARGNNTANKGYTDLLQLWMDGDVLLDSRDQNGIPFKGIAATTADADTYGGAGSAVGAATAEDGHPPLILTPPKTFTQGDILTPKVTVTGAASGGIGAAGLDLCLALERIRA